MRMAHRLRVIEAAVALTVVGAALRFIPFRLVAKLAGAPRQASSPKADARDPAAAAVGRAVAAAARRLPWQPVCLPQALAAALMLRCRGVRSQVCFGVRREEGGIKAHAWLVLEDRFGGGVVCGGGFGDNFTPIAGLGGSGSMA